MKHWSFGKLLLVTFPMGAVVGGAFGAIMAGVFDRGPSAHLEPTKGLLLFAAMTIAIGLGGAVAIRFDLH